MHNICMQSQDILMGRVTAQKIMQFKESFAFFKIVGSFQRLFPVPPEGEGADDRGHQGSGLEERVTE